MVARGYCNTVEYRQILSLSHLFSDLLSYFVLQYELTDISSVVSWQKPNLIPRILATWHRKINKFQEKKKKCAKGDTHPQGTLGSFALFCLPWRWWYHLFLFICFHFVSIIITRTVTHWMGNVHECRWQSWTIAPVLGREKRTHWCSSHSVCPRWRRSHVIVDCLPSQSRKHSKDWKPTHLCAPRELKQMCWPCLLIRKSCYRQKNISHVLADSFAFYTRNCSWFHQQAHGLLGLAHNQWF